VVKPNTGVLLRNAIHVQTGFVGAAADFHVRPPQ